MLDEMHLRGVANDSGTVRDEKEVDSNTESEQVGRRIGGDIAGCIVDVELASTRNVHVTRGLILSRVEREVQHHGTGVLRGSDIVRLTVAPEEEIAVEGSGVSVEESDTMNLELQSVDSLGGDRVGNMHDFGEGRDLFVLVGAGIEGDRVVDHDVTSATRGDRDSLIVEAGELVPIARLIGVGRINVVSRAHTDIDRLNGILELVEENLLTGRVDARRLVTMETDQREADTLDVDIMAIIPRWRETEYRYLGCIIPHHLA